jgi:hypothetical protein
VSNVSPTPIASTVAPLLLAAVGFGVCIAFNNGAYDPRGINVLFGAILVLAWCFFREKRGGISRDSIAELIAPGLWAGLAFSLFWGWNDDGLIMYAQHPWTTGRTAMSWMAILLLTYLPGLVLRFREPKWLSWARFGIFVLLVVIAGVDTFKTSTKPWIDVWTVQQQGAEALLHGHNPYTAVAAADTTPGRSGPTPYVYPPTQVLVGLFGSGFFHDVRYSMLLAVIVAGVGMRLLTAKNPRGLPPLVADAPSLFLFFTPKLFFILEQSWVDPVQLAFITTAICLFVYERRLAAVIVFGFAASSKQTLFWLVPLVGFSLRFTIREWIIMGVAAAAPVVPFAIWDFHALKYGNFDFLTHLPPRPDALTLGNWMNRRFQTTLTGILGFPFAAVVVAIGSLRGRGPAALAVAVAFTYAIFFTFSKQAFANYYFFVAGLAALASAAHLAERTAPVVVETKTETKSETESETKTESKPVSEDDATASAKDPEPANSSA